MWKISRNPFAQEATQDADEPMHAPDDISTLAEKVAALHAVLDASRPLYEYTDPRAVGGIPSASAYSTRVPFATPCEVSVVMVTTTDLNSVTLTLSADPNLDIMASGSPNLTASLDGNQGFLLIVSPQTLASSPASVTGPANWFPVQGGTQLYVRVGSSGSKASYVMLQFRRRINPVGVPSNGPNF